jgi:PhzF family phenazine biosynthesis protein
VNARCKNGVASATIPHNLHVHESKVYIEGVLASQPRLEHAMATQRLDMDVSSFPVVSIVKGMTFALVQLAQIEDRLDALEATGLPIPGLSHKIDEGWEPSLIAPYFYVLGSHRKEDDVMKIRARLIEPRLGEDPATGSGASALAAYLSLMRGGPGQTYRYEIEQGVEMGRRSVIRVSVELDESGKGLQTVTLEGEVARVMEGKIWV